jgi:diadenosine tetraphosphate (Ap4A) HIT family hydrolase
MSNTPACPLCADNHARHGSPRADGAVWVHQLPDCRVIRVAEAGFPAFYRVVWQAHVAELSDLQPASQVRIMQMVAVVEQALRAVLAPTKINIASLGNMVPHLHWHVVARFEWDSHFPAPIWAAACRPLDEARCAEVVRLLPQVDALIQHHQTL